MVECRTRNRESPGSNPLCYRVEVWAFLFAPLTPLLTQLYKWVPGYRQWWKCECLVIARNCCMARMLLGEAEFVSEWTGLSGMAKSVKRFERSNGLDTALYKNYLFLPSPTTIPIIRPHFVWRAVFSVSTIPDQRPSLRRDQRPGQIGFSPSRTTTSPTEYFQESWVAVQHPFPMVYYYNVVPRHLSSNSIDLNFLLIWRRSYIYVTFSDRRCIVTMLPACRRSNTIVVGLIQVLWTSHIRGAVIINGSTTWCFM